MFQGLSKIKEKMNKLKMVGQQMLGAVHTHTHTHTDNFIKRKGIIVGAVSTVILVLICVIILLINTNVLKFDRIEKNK